MVRTGADAPSSFVDVAASRSPVPRRAVTLLTGSLEPQSRSGGHAAAARLAGLLLDEENVHSVLQRIVHAVSEIMPGGSEASITLLRNEQPTTVAFSGELARDLDESQYEHGYGPCLEAALGGHLVEITDGRTEGRWPRYMPTFVARGALSSLAAPVPGALLTAGLNVYATTAQAFADTDRQALVEFAGYAGVALANLDALTDARELAENLQKAMESRAVIEQAKGIVMERHKLTADQAFRVIAEASMQTNRKVRDLAENLVRTGNLGPDDPRPPGQEGEA
jgi:GAF domain-containing protein